MIETISDLLKLLHRYPSSTRITIGHDCDDVAHLSGDVLNAAEGEIVLTLAPLPMEPPAKQEPPHANNKAGRVGAAADAIDQCDRILTMCDEVDSDSRGADFVAEIAEKVQSVRDWVEEKNHVTEKQLSALNGWERGVEKWTN